MVRERGLKIINIAFLCYCGLFILKAFVVVLVNFTYLYSFVFMFYYCCCEIVVAVGIF